MKSGLLTSMGLNNINSKDNDIKAFDKYGVE